MDPVVVTGMHRSGTSLVTRLLDRAGLFVGRDLESNHESRFFIQRNRWVLRTAGASWDHPQPVAELAGDDRARAAMAEHLRARCRHAGMHRYAGRLRALRVRDLGRMERWGWKDPRNTLTLPFWREAFPDLRVVHVERHGVDVAASLVTRYHRLQGKVEAGRGGFLRWPRAPRVPRRAASDVERAFALWTAYGDAARAWLGDVEHHAIRYEGLLADPAGVLPGVLEFCGLDADADALADGIDASRAYAHRNDPELAAFADRHADALGAHGYPAHVA